MNISYKEMMEVLGEHTKGYAFIVEGTNSEKMKKYVEVFEKAIDQVRRRNPVVELPSLETEMLVETDGRGKYTMQLRAINMAGISVRPHGLQQKKVLCGKWQKLLLGGHYQNMRRSEV